MSRPNFGTSALRRSVLTNRRRAQDLTGRSSGGPRRARPPTGAVLRTIPV